MTIYEMAATSMDKSYKLVATIFTAFLPVLGFSQMTRTEYSIGAIKRARTTNTNYKKYDLNGNVIEEGEYGEIEHFSSSTKSSDSTTAITIGHARNYHNINSVKFNQYDNKNRISQDELWQYHNNSKSHLIYRTQYDYNAKDQLTTETEFDKDNKISRKKAYHISGNRIASIDTVYKFTNEGISRVDGVRRDTTYLDTLNRPKEIIHFFNGKFLYRQVYLYDKYGYSKTELRYDRKPDSLWCITEFRYDPRDHKITRHFWKVIASSTETKEIYEYDKKRRLVRIHNYSVDELTGYKEFEYDEK